MLLTELNYELSTDIYELIHLGYYFKQRKAPFHRSDHGSPRVKVPVDGCCWFDQWTQQVHETSIHGVAILVTP